MTREKPKKMHEFRILFYLLIFISSLLYLWYYSVIFVNFIQFVIIFIRFLQYVINFSYYLEYLNKYRYLIIWLHNNLVKNTKLIDFFSKYKGIASDRIILSPLFILPVSLFASISKYRVVSFFCLKRIRFQILLKALISNFGEAV